MEYKTFVGTLGGIHGRYSNSESFQEMGLGKQITLLAEDGWIVKQIVSTPLAHDTEKGGNSVLEAVFYTILLERETRPRVASVEVSKIHSENP
jgi:hypothetical protein